MIESIYSYVKTIPIIDTHEHLPLTEAERPRHDVIAEFLIHYLSVDLVSAGLSKSDLERCQGDQLTVGEKWALLAPYWDSCRYTGYAQAIELAARDIYGIEHIDGSSIAALNDAYLKAYDTPHYDRVLKELSGIELSIVDCCETWNDLHYDPKYFRLSNRIDAMVRPSSGSDLDALEHITGVTISRFEDYLLACEKRIEQLAACSPILKLGLAYARSLYFPRATRHEAERGFDQLMHSGYYIHRREQHYCCDPAFSSYILHFILGLAQEKGLVIQIHTGLQEGNGNLLTNCNPTHLNELFLAYPGVQFDLFHIGYPYQNEFGTLCKMFPNVYADMCWAHIVSPVAARRTLNEWLELFSYTKISGFGGDFMLVDGVYGHQYIARRNIAWALSEKVEEGLFDEEAACRIAKAILHDNPARLFKL